MHTARFVGKESGGNQLKKLPGNAQNRRVYARKKAIVSQWLASPEQYNQKGYRISFAENLKTSC